MDRVFREPLRQALERVTFLVHTRNRPAFLARLLDHFERQVGDLQPRIVILDASLDDEWKRFEQHRSDRRYSFTPQILRAPPERSIQRRVEEGLAVVTTPYVILAADDDLYFFDWIGIAVRMLDEDPALGTLYGQVMKFDLGGFVSIGKSVRCWFERRRNPAAVFLESDRIADRLAALSRCTRGLATVGWYAIQRREQLQTILRCAGEYDLDGLLFEVFLNIAQPALGKVRMLDELMLARQVDRRRAQPPLGVKGFEREFQNFERAVESVLAGRPELSTTETADLAKRLIAPHAELAAAADRKRPLRWFARRFPLLHGLYRKLAAHPVEAEEILDPRLPGLPEIANQREAVGIIEAATAPSG